MSAFAWNARQEQGEGDHVAHALRRQGLQDAVHRGDVEVQEPRLHAQPRPQRPYFAYERVDRRGMARIAAAVSDHEQDRAGGALVHDGVSSSPGGRGCAGRAARGLKISRSMAMPTIRIRKMARKTMDMELALRPFSSWPSPMPRSGDEAMISAAISERHENAQPCFRPAR